MLNWLPSWPEGWNYFIMFIKSQRLKNNIDWVYRENKQFNKCSSLGFISYVLPSPLSRYKYANAAFAPGSSIPVPAHPNHPLGGRSASCPKVKNATHASTSTLPLKIQCQGHREADSLTDCWCPTSFVQNIPTDFTSSHKMSLVSFLCPEQWLCICNTFVSIHETLYKQPLWHQDQVF